MISKSEFDSLKVGDKVKIVNSWSSGSNQNAEGRMDHWLGQIMTIKDVVPFIYESRARMEEDQHEREGGWIWNRLCIDCVIRYEAVGLEELI